MTQLWTHLVLMRDMPAYRRLKAGVCEKCKWRRFFIGGFGPSGDLWHLFCRCGPRGPFLRYLECKGCSRQVFYAYRGGRKMKWCDRCVRVRNRQYQARARAKKRGGVT